MSTIPVRCFTCGKIIGNNWEKYQTLLESGTSPNIALAEVGLRRYCCNRMFLGHVEIIDKLLLYSEYKNNDSKEKSAKI